MITYNWSELKKKCIQSTSNKPNEWILILITFELNHVNASINSATTLEEIISI